MKNLINDNDISREELLLLTKGSAVEIADLKVKIASLTEQLENANAFLDWFKRNVFGQKSERYTEGDSEIDDLFGANPNDDAIEPDDKSPEGGSGNPRGKKKNKSATLSFSDKVPVEEVIIDVPESERTCPITGELLQPIGDDRKVEVFITPAKVIKRVTIRPKYSRLKQTASGVETEIIQANAVV